MKKQTKRKSTKDIVSNDQFVTMGNLEKKINESAINLRCECEKLIQENAANQNSIILNSICEILTYGVDKARLRPMCRFLMNVYRKNKNIRSGK